MQAEEIQSILSRLNKEGDTAAAILGAAWLDSLLRQRLEISFIPDATAVQRLVNETGGNSPLGSFSSRTELAYCLGILPRNVRNDLVYIRKIRNKFAHKIDHVTFEVTQIRDWCSNLDVVSQLGLPAETPRSRFELTVAIIALTLQRSIGGMANERPVSPKDFRAVFDEGSWSTLEEAKSAP